MARVDRSADSLSSILRIGNIRSRSRGCDRVTFDKDYSHERAIILRNGNNSRNSSRNPLTKNFISRRGVLAKEYSSEENTLADRLFSIAVAFHRIDLSRGEIREARISDPFPVARRKKHSRRSRREREISMQMSRDRYPPRHLSPSAFRPPSLSPPSTGGVYSLTNGGNTLARGVQHANFRIKDFEPAARLIKAFGVSPASGGRGGAGSDSPPRGGNKSRELRVHRR